MFPCDYTILVRTFSFGKFITHDAIASKWFNIDHVSTIPSMTAWDLDLVNTLPVLELMLDRMQGDFETLTVKMRRPWGSKEIESCTRLGLRR